MKVVAVNGSARKGGNTAIMIEAAFAPLRQAGIACEMISLAGKTVGGCTACMRCRHEADRQCHGRDDFGNEVITALDSADGILLASPVYFADITPELKAIIDRAGYVARGNAGMFTRKVGSGITVHRRAGAIHALDSINHFFLISDMIVVGSSYWNLGVGGTKGDADGDEEGLRTMRRLGENMTWLLQRIGG
ncbi:MAG: flavodoxin family protein [Coriobacteriia bacterium]|jgi:multimeric flavodoxin WrbA|nr:flavodoxin family protein [Coriobacteriia bacterium]